MMMIKEVGAEIPKKFKKRRVKSTDDSSDVVDVTFFNFLLTCFHSHSGTSRPVKQWLLDHSQTITIFTPPENPSSDNSQVYKYRHDPEDYHEHNHYPSPSESEIEDEIPYTPVKVAIPKLVLTEDGDVVVAQEQNDRGQHDAEPSDNPEESDEEGCAPVESDASAMFSVQSSVATSDTEFEHCQQPNKVVLVGASLNPPKTGVDQIPRIHNVPLQPPTSIVQPEPELHGSPVAIPVLHPPEAPCAVRRPEYQQNPTKIVGVSTCIQELVNIWFKDSPTDRNLKCYLASSLQVLLTIPEVDQGLATNNYPYLQIRTHLLKFRDIIHGHLKQTEELKELIDLIAPKIQLDYSVYNDASEIFASLVGALIEEEELCIDDGRNCDFLFSQLFCFSVLTPGPTNEFEEAAINRNMIVLNAPNHKQQYDHQKLQSMVSQFFLSAESIHHSPYLMVNCPVRQPTFKQRKKWNLITHEWDTIYDEIPARPYSIQWGSSIIIDNVQYEVTHTLSHFGKHWTAQIKAQDSWYESNSSDSGKVRPVVDHEWSTTQITTTNVRCFLLRRI